MGQTPLSTDWNMAVNNQWAGKWSGTDQLKIYYQQETINELQGEGLGGTASLAPQACVIGTHPTHTLTASSSTARCLNRSR